MFKKLLLATLVGAVSAAAITYWLVSGGQQKTSSVAADTPMYWVAPMDAAYRRDQPGKSPMGMDLVPVYPNKGGADDSPGTVFISPGVENNLSVRTALATMKVLDNTIQTVGYVQYNQDSMSHIHPRIEGWIERLYVKADGDPVVKGQALYSLYAPQLVAAQEELILAMNRRNKELIAGAENRLAALQLGDKFIRQLKRTRKVQQTITFYAPQGGVVGNLLMRQGGYVKPGQSLMMIADMDEVWVEAEIFSAQAEAVAVGLPVAMTLEYLPGRKWMGEVDYIYPSLNPQTRTLRVRIRFANKKLLLKPNMFADIKIMTQSNDPALLVPSEAVIRTGSQDRVVLALGAGRFKSIEVTLGRKSDQFIEILEGLSAGDSVVSSAQFLLDSESSKSSDFKRLDSSAEPMGSMSMADMAAMPTAAVPVSVWVAAAVEKLMADSSRIRLKHDAIPEWQRPSMSMLLAVDDSVSLDAIDLHQPVRVQLTQTGSGTLLVTAILPLLSSGAVEGSDND